MFEVGKKYQQRGSGIIAECLFVDDEIKQVVLRLGVSKPYLSIWQIDETNKDDWTEYKELVTITKYAYVIKNELGVVMFDNGLYGNENEARRDFDFSYGEYGYTILAIIPVTYTDETSVEAAFAPPSTDWKKPRMVKHSV